MPASLGTGTWRSAMGALLLSSSVAFGQDATALATRLVPTYLAQDVAAVCEFHVPGFFRSVTADFPDANAFAQHAKGETLEALAGEDAIAVLRAAADQARALARAELAPVDVGPPAVAAYRIAKWCARDGRLAVLAALSAHARSHAARPEGRTE